MKKKVLLFFISIFSILINTSFSFGEINREDYEKILLELPAFPYMIERGETLIHRSIRLDVKGWVSPYKSNFFKLSASEIKRYDFPPTMDRIKNWYEKYKYLLDRDLIEIRKDDNLFTIINFLLEIISKEDIEIENKEIFIRLANYNLGFKSSVINILIKNKCITHENSIEIFKNSNSFFLENYFFLDMIFPVPQVDEKKYISFLLGSIHDENMEMFYKTFFLKQLFFMDNAKYKDGFYSLALKAIPNEKNEFRRAYLFECLIETEDPFLLKKMANYFGSDEDTVCRMAIIKKLCDIAYIDNGILDVFDRISKGKSERHFSRNLGLNPTSWQDRLVSYLGCIKRSNSEFSNNNRLNRILKIIADINIFKYKNKEEYFNFFNIHSKK